jgi:acetylornithine deacetylase
MKAFVATSMVVFSDLVRADFSGTIGLVIVTDEELGGRCGARHLVEDLGYTADTVLVPDDGEAIDRVIGDTKHILQLSFVAKGKEAHACRPWNGQNAITALFTTYQKLAIALDKLAAEDAKEASDPNWITTYNIGTINGGVATNEVPEQAEMTVDVRFVAPTTRAQLMQLVEESLAPGVKMNVALEGPPTTLMRDAVVDAYLQSIAECTGKVPQLVGALGGTDGRYFAYAGMRTIVHQSAGGNAQAADEYVETQGLLDLVQIQKQFIETTYGG